MLIRSGYWSKTNPQSPHLSLFLWLTVRWSSFLWRTSMCRHDGRQRQLMWNTASCSIIHHFHIVLDAVIWQNNIRLKDEGHYDLILQCYATSYGIIGGKAYYERVQYILNMIMKDFYHWLFWWFWQNQSWCKYFTSEMENSAGNSIQQENVYICAKANQEKNGNFVSIMSVVY